MLSKAKHPFYESNAICVNGIPHFVRNDNFPVIDRTTTKRRLRMTEPIVIWRSVRCKNPACNDDFKFKFTVTPEQLKETRIIVKMTCPFCKHKLSVDLAQWKQNTIIGYRGEAVPAATNDISILRLPEELPSELDND